MSRHTVAATAGLLVIWTFCLGSEPAPPPTRATIEAEMGLPSQEDIRRGQMDTTGFVVSAAQAEDVISTAVALESEAMRATDAELGLDPQHGYVGGICPHDDHLYAARAYVHLSERITAPRVIMIGVFHAARLWDLENRLVFDDFQSWHGPWAPVEVDPLRQLIIERLRPDSFVVDNAMHCREHSLEAIVPFLQIRDRDRTIVPILVPYASWTRLAELADELSTIVAGIMTERGWQLGRDLAVVVSSDAVHYGPDFEHAPFGTDAAAYQRAVERERRLAHAHLEGPISADKLAAFEYTLVDEHDLRSYKIPWCGRFSIPFGLELLRQLAAKTGLPTPTGKLLRYATSLSEPLLPVSATTREAGLGVTAPSNFHHWVGYASVGYTLQPATTEETAPLNAAMQPLSLNSGSVDGSGGLAVLE